MLTMRSPQKPRAVLRKPYDAYDFTSEHIKDRIWILRLTAPITATGVSATTTYRTPFNHRILEIHFIHTTSAGVASTDSMDLKLEYLDGTTYIAEYSINGSIDSDIALDYTGEDRVMPITMYRITQNTTATDKIYVTLKLEVLD